MKTLNYTAYIVRGLIVVGVLASMSSCGGGSNSSANTSAINGIAVPPEPDPVKNNATVAGVDENSNGVRDDVERKIAAIKTDQQEFDRLMLSAQVTQALITGNSAKYKEIVCGENFRTSLAGEETSEFRKNFEVRMFVLNTTERQNYTAPVSDDISYGDDGKCQ